MSDTFVKCDRCGRQTRVAFAKGLARGWPECCGETMRLVRTNADIGATVGDHLADTPLPRVRAFFEGRGRI